MGESSKNYQNGKIYCIRTTIDDDIYVGSTTQLLSKRMAWHRDGTKHEKKKHLKIYQKMTEHGYDNFYIELLEECPSENVEQRRREGEMIRELRPVLNKAIVGRTIKEWYEDNTHQKKEQTKQYKDEHQEWYKEYYKEYAEANKVKITDYQKAWYIHNKDRIQKHRAIKTECECGGSYTTGHKSEHLKTRKHQQYLKSNEEK